MTVCNRSELLLSSSVSLSPDELEALLKLREVSISASGTPAKPAADAKASSPSSGTATSAAGGSADSKQSTAPSSASAGDFKSAGTKRTAFRPFFVSYQDEPRGELCYLHHRLSAIRAAARGPDARMDAEAKRLLEELSAQKTEDSIQAEVSEIKLTADSLLEVRSR